MGHAASREATTQFRLAGRIVAARLPQGMLVPGVLVRRDSAAARLARPKNLFAKSGRDSGGGFISAGPSEISIESDVIIELRVRATDEAEAAKAAQEKFIRPLTAALILATERPAYVELTRVATEGPDGQVGDQGSSTWSDLAFMANLGDMPTMDGNEQASLVGTMQTFRHDKVAASAASDLVEAAKMQWTTGGRQAEVEAAVLRYFLVIERIATRVASNRPLEKDEADRQGRIVADLARDLRNQPTGQAVRRIQNAAKALQESDAQRLTQDITYTCELVGLPDEVRDAAINLNRVRNQALAHPGSRREHYLLAEASRTASSTAEAFLRVYTAWRSERR